MVTYGNFIIGLRQYIEEQTGVTTVWRYPGYAPPKPPYIAIEFVNTVYYNRTKMKDLISQDIYLNAAHYATDVIQYTDTQAKLHEILLHHTIPLMDTKGEQIGEFSVARINSDIAMPFGTIVEDETNRWRTYTDFKVELDHIRLYKRNTDE